MKNPTLHELRTAFLKFFASKGHLCLKSFPLTPENDPTLLFVNAGMAPLKNFFLGLNKPEANCMATCQKCLRVGGKHNDLEQIGYTKRHHTFFEMLGNFSFGAFFKKEAIHFAWEFLTDELKIDKKKLYVTVHPEDKESYDIWLALLDESHITKLDENLWFMGDEGPCGCCTEIFYDLGEKLEGAQPGKGPEGDRFLEVWNLVFMEKEQLPDGSFKDLPVKCVDTGIGLERLAAVLSDTDDTYNIPDMQQLIKLVEKITGVKKQVAHKVLADHTRAIAFLMADGVMPSAEGRGYVLRKIIRRAARFGYALGHPRLTEKLLPLVVEIMKESYPELVKAKTFALDTLKYENERFVAILGQGMQKVEEELAKDKKISGEFAFTLYDTYGFPVEILNDIARENDLALDLEEFERLIAQQKERSKKAWHGTGDLRAKLDVKDLPETIFQGYENVQGRSKVLVLYKDGEKIKHAKQGDQVSVIFDQTVFYGESGGQVADKGILQGVGMQAQVIDVQIVNPRVFVHTVMIDKGSLKEGDVVEGQIDLRRRSNVKRYHTATHLLHTALRKLIGEHIIQKGSLVDAERLRFDFAHHKALTLTELQAIEEQVNEWISMDYQVANRQEKAQDAIDQGAMALFGEKYPEIVRVVEINGMQDERVSLELCGGTHVKHLGEIGTFKITKESSVSSGVRRIEALCGVDLVVALNRDVALLEEACQKLKTDKGGLLMKVDKLMSQKTNVSQQLEVTEKHGKCLALVVETNVEAKQMSDVLSKVQQKHKDGNAILVLTALSEEKTGVLINLDEKARKVYGSAKELFLGVKGAKGGGKDHLVQGSIDAVSVKKLKDLFWSKVEK